MLILEPIADRIIVKAVPMPDVSGGGIIIPDAAKDRPVEGEVMEVGPGAWDNGVFIPMQVQRGDKVLYGKHAGTEFKHEGVELLSMRESDLHAILRKQRRPKHSMNEIMAENDKAKITKPTELVRDDRPSKPFENDKITFSNT